MELRTFLKIIHYHISLFQNFSINQNLRKLFTENNPSHNIIHTHSNIKDFFKVLLMDFKKKIFKCSHMFYLVLFSFYLKKVIFLNELFMYLSDTVTNFMIFLFYNIFFFEKDLLVFHVI